MGADAQGTECNFAAEGSALIGVTVVRLDPMGGNGPVVTIRRVRGRVSAWTYEFAPGILPAYCPTRGTLTAVE